MRGGGEKAETLCELHTAEVIDAPELWGELEDVEYVMLAGVAWWTAHRLMSALGGIPRVEHKVQANQDPSVMRAPAGLNSPSLPESLTKLLESFGDRIAILRRLPDSTLHREMRRVRR